MSSLAIIWLFLYVVPSTGLFEYDFSIVGKDIKSTRPPLTTHQDVTLLSCGVLCARSYCEGLNFTPTVGMTTGTCDVMGNGTVAAGFTEAVGTDFYRGNGTEPDKYFFGLNRTFDVALLECPLLHPEAKLVDVRNAQEKDILNGIAAGLDADCVWTSGRRRDGATFWDIDWVTTGEPLGYSNWEPGQPYPGGEPEDDCVSMWKVWDWRWNDADCGLRCAFICRA